MKFIDLEAQYRQIKEPLDAALAELFVRQDFILGKDVDILEARLAEYVGVRHCITCSNGTDALSMPLMLLNLAKSARYRIPLPSMRSPSPCSRARPPMRMAPGSR